MDRGKFHVAGPPKVRGRPRKPAQNSPQEERRARGREAQRTYMMRKQAEMDKLHRRIDLLQDTIEGMSNEFLDFGKRVVTASQGPSAPKTLAVFRKATERFLEMARAAENETSGDEGSGRELSSKVLSITQTTRHADPSTELSPLMSDPCLASGPPIPTQSETLVSSPNSIFTYTYTYTPAVTSLPASLDPNQQLSTQSGRFSPRLGYGLSLNYAPRTVKLWTHYLVAGSNSFALRLYKDTLTLICRVIIGEISIPGFIPSICRYRFQHERTEDFLHQALDQLTKMSLEEPSSPTPEAHTTSSDGRLVLFGPSHPVMMHPLRQMIAKDANREIGQLNEWLDPWYTQQYLSTRWGLQLTYDTATVTQRTPATLGFGGISVGSPESHDSRLWNLSSIRSVDTTGFFPPPTHPASNEQPFILNSLPLAEDLIQHSICFGEGPRFLKEEIDAAAQRFLQSSPHNRAMINDLKRDRLESTSIP